MITWDIKVGDVVQIDPGSDRIFGGTFLTVTKVKDRGVQGYVAAIGATMKESDMNAPLAYYRVDYKNIVRIGRAEWVDESEADSIRSQSSPAR